MLSKQMKGEIDSWAIRWCFQQSLDDRLTLFPRVSKIESIGFGAAATHTQRTTRFDTQLDPGDQLEFSLPDEIVADPTLNRQFRWRFSPLRRALDRLPCGLSRFFN